ncbi:MAG: cytochrome c oxidase assembly factor Coa1 family protein [Roseimicrobium sp.]
MDTPPLPPPVPPIPAKEDHTVKWVLFGCGGCLVLLTLAALMFGGIVWGALNLAGGILKQSEVYATAYTRALNSTEVQEALGTPIEPGFLPEGSINVDGNKGDADITIPLKGPKGEAKLIVTGHRSSANPWEYTVLEVRLPDGRKIDLREAR